MNTVLEMLALLNPALGKDAGAAILSRLRVDALIAADGDDRRLAELSYEPVIDTPRQFEALIRSDIARYADIIKRAGIDARRSAQGAPQ